MSSREKESRKPFGSLSVCPKCLGNDPQKEYAFFSNDGFCLFVKCGRCRYEIGWEFTADDTNEANKPNPPPQTSSFCYPPPTGPDV